MTEFVARKASTLPIIDTVTDDDLVMVLQDSTPPDIALASIDAIAERAGVYAPQGPQGATGPQGDKGDRGDSLAIKGAVANEAALGGVPNPSVGDTYVTIDDGSLWVFDGSIWAKVATAIGPQGPQGPAGAQGPVGPKGDTGPAGPAGAAGGALPIGTIIDHIGGPTPTGFLPCDGSEYDDAAYPALAALIKTLPEWPQSATIGKFRTPPLNGHTTVGVDPSSPIFGSAGRRGGRSDAIVVEHNHPPGGLKAELHKHVLGGSTTDESGHNHYVSLGGGSHRHTEEAPGAYGWLYIRPPGGGSYDPYINSGVGTDRGGIQYLQPSVGIGGSDHGHAGYTGGGSAHRHNLNAETGNSTDRTPIVGDTANRGVPGENQNYQPSYAVVKLIRALP
jgi:hypothetical protein